MTRRYRSRRPLLLLLLLDLTGCACAPEHEIGVRVETATLVQDARGPLLTGPGADADHPIERCGPRDSYDWLADRFRCPGTHQSPFHGDWHAAARSRAGAVRHDHRGHIVDVYEAPCSSGLTPVYVDMYACGTPPR